MYIQPREREGEGGGEREGGGHIGRICSSSFGGSVSSSELSTPNLSLVAFVFVG